MATKLSNKVGKLFSKVGIKIGPVSAQELTQQLRQCFPEFRIVDKSTPKMRRIWMKKRFFQIAISGIPGADYSDYVLVTKGIPIWLYVVTFDAVMLVQNLIGASELAQVQRFLKDKHSAEQK